MVMLAFLIASGSIATTNSFLLNPIRLFMESRSFARPSSTASFASTASTTSSSAGAGNPSRNGDKPRILCLHGKFQSGAIFSNKIAGARRKIAREYELDFLDGPILLPQNDEDGGEDNNKVDGNDAQAPHAWWLRSEEDGKHILVREAFEYVMQQPKTDEYDAIIAFSQGGTLATALVLSGAFPNVKALVTAGAPYIPEAFEVASEISKGVNNGFDVPKLHLAGEKDAMVAVESTRELCEKGGNGTLIVHDQGHLFPTRSARVREILDFLQMTLSENKEG